jgi:hypothetical protein
MQEISSAQGLTRTSRENQIVRIVSLFVKNGEDRKSFWTKWNRADTSLRLWSVEVPFINGCRYTQRQGIRKGGLCASSSNWFH